ncbi:hypothetical protein [Aeromonas phage phiWae14]|nr:hypothetical protein [Aeromonas phage phiWae14]
MKIEIYGIPEELFKCPGCIAAVDFCKSYSFDYEFIPVLIKDESPIGFRYDIERIDECKTRANKDTRPRQYPQIFVDDKWIGGYQTFKEKYEAGEL